VSVVLPDIRLYGSANMPEADGATVGGAIDFTKRIEFADIAANGLFDAVSSSASDTATKIIYLYRDASGVALSNETLTLNGTTKVAGTKTCERLLAAAVSGGAIAGLANPTGTTAVGDIAFMAHTLTISAHTMQVGAANATGLNPPIAKLQSGDGASCAIGMVLHSLTGTGANQIRRILAINPNGLGADFVALDRNLGTLFDATTTYEVAPGLHFELTGSNNGVAITGTSTQVLAIARMFSTEAAQASGGSSVTAYEKYFINNNNQTTALTTAAHQILSETAALPSGALLDIALCKALNDTATATNRVTLPANGDASALTFVTQPAAVSVIAGSAQLPASAGAGSATNAQGVWARLTLPAGTAQYKGLGTPRNTGNTT
jgi:hypothetical protein